MVDLFIITKVRSIRWSILTMSSNCSIIKFIGVLNLVVLVEEHILFLIINFKILLGCDWTSSEFMMQRYGML